MKNRIYIETQVTPMPLKYFAHKEFLGGLFGVAYVWNSKKAAKEYYKMLGLKCPELEVRIAEIKSLKAAGRIKDRPKD